jgi:hypothetical protein
LNAHVTARILLVVFGCTGALWGLATFPTFKRNADIDDLAAYVIRGFAYRPQLLQDKVPVLDAIENDRYCQARALRSDVIIRMRILELALNNADIAHLDGDLAATRSAIRKSLSCSPADAYAWLSLFWLNSISIGFKPDDLALLRMSYQEGPNEGWVMVKRNRFALAIFPYLPPELAELALSEFAKSLQPEFVLSAVDNFVGPGWPIRATLLARIKDTPKPQIEAFARILQSRGYEVDVPGIERNDHSIH